MLYSSISCLFFFFVPLEIHVLDMIKFSQLCAVTPNSMVFPLEV
uniref:Uncharacterized protein n=1 Tax=Rhizophora mucronata TaxID=61149 RepID=A0A2P2KJQ6_RHIMU